MQNISTLNRDFVPKKHRSGVFFGTKSRFKVALTLFLQFHGVLASFYALWGVLEADFKYGLILVTKKISKNV